MTIWILNPFDELPGEGAPPGRFWALARTLAARGHRVTWWSAGFSHRNKKPRSGIPERHDGFEIRLVPVPGYARNVGWARVRSHRVYARNWLTFAEASGERPEVIVASLPPIDGPSAALKWRERHGARLVLDLMDAWPDNFADLLPAPAFLRPILGRVLFAPWHAAARRAMRSADAISAAGERYLETARKCGAKAPMHRCYLGADAAPYRSLAPRSAAPGEPLHLLYLGNFGRSQDVACLVRAIALLPKELPVRFTAAGGGDLEASVRALAAELGVGDRLALPGFVRGEALVSLIGSAHLGLNLVRPGSGIACPYKMGDYLCGGLPVINGLTGESHELLQRAACGFNYTAGDPESLAAAVKTSLSCRDRLPELSARAFAVGGELFDRERTYPKFAEWLETAISKRRG